MESLKSFICNPFINVEINKQSFVGVSFWLHLKTPKCCFQFNNNRDFDKWKILIGLNFIATSMLSFFI